MSTIRDRVLRGIALNRVPGFHFAGTFLEISYDKVDSADTFERAIYASRDT